jgi:Tfp pilus assembly protein PilF
MTEPRLQADRLLIVGLLDRAEALYRQALARDPRDAAALIGLANCQAERGDLASAYALTLQVLDLDRRNATALRMEARISEILAGQGAPVRRPAWIR